MRRLACLLALVLASGAAAQQPSQIKAGDQVDFAKLHEAMQKVTATGLISKIDFEYESLPDKETDVILHMKCTDVMPLAQGVIQIAKVDQDDVWKWLAQVDPLFTRELPPTEAAIRLYSIWIGKYMEGHGVPMFQDNFAVVADASGKDAAEKLVFKVVKRRGRK